MILGMLGGQIHKAVRRYGISFISIVTTLLTNKKSFKEKARNILLFLSLIVAFSIGYGENSTLSKWLKKDWQRRLVYALILSIGFVFFKMWYAPIILVAVWQIRIGGFAIGKYDFLFEDVLRYLTVGILITILTL